MYIENYMYIEKVTAYVLRSIIRFLKNRIYAQNEMYVTRNLIEFTAIKPVQKDIRDRNDAEDAAISANNILP